MDARTEQFVAARTQLWTRPGPSGSGRRRAYADLVDAWLRDLLLQAGGADQPVALVAVGGTGRRELAPGSDLDLVLIHEAGADISAVADRLWYPVWDAGLRLDHSVRTIDQALRVARDDLKAAVGLLDSRHVAGRVGLAADLREKALAGWRASAPHRFGELREAARARAEQHGELAYLLEPDLKESFGGLRESVALRALAASWLVDVPRGGVAESTELLLDVRDALHRTTGRASDRLTLQDQAQAALLVDQTSADDLLRAVCGAGRTLAYATDAAWHRADRATRRPARRPLLRRGAPVPPARRPLAEGVVEDDGEVALARDVVPGEDAGLGLRAAAAAAQAGLRLAPVTVERIRASPSHLPDPWSREMRESFVALLGAGSSALPVWEALDQAGLWSAWLPGWERLRALPQHNPVHTFTVDRHLVEAALQAASLTRRVQRPDLLLVGALLHDVGKGLPGDHSEQGVPIVRTLAARMGFPQADVDVLVDLCRHHLLLPETATRRDLEDAATTATIADVVGTADQLDLLYALTEADARATGPLAWTPWRASLVAELVSRTHAVLKGHEPTDASGERIHPLEGTTGLVVQLVPDGHVQRVHVAHDDQPGLMATVAGVLSLNRLAVRAATLSTSGTRALQTWTVQTDFGDPPAAEQLREDLRAALEGRLDLDQRLAAREKAYARPRIRVPDPRVDVLHDASARATILEVRAHDGPALLHRVGAAIARTGVGIWSARVSTMGADAVDVFYLAAPDGSRLTPVEAAAVAEAVNDDLRSWSVAPEGRGR